MALTRTWGEDRTPRIQNTLVLNEDGEHFREKREVVEVLRACQPAQNFGQLRQDLVVQTQHCRHFSLAYLRVHGDSSPIPSLPPLPSPFQPLADSCILWYPIYLHSRICLCKIYGPRVRASIVFLSLGLHDFTEYALPLYPFSSRRLQFTADDTLSYMRTCFLYSLSADS